jgi:hypothetical protein
VTSWYSTLVTCSGCWRVSRVNDAATFSTASSTKLQCLAVFSTHLEHNYIAFNLCSVVAACGCLALYKCHVLPTQCIYVFFMDIRINTDYFPIQHYLIYFYNGDGACLLRGTDSVFLYVPPGLTFTNSTFCPRSIFMCFVWISEQTAIISLYSIN